MSRLLVWAQVVILTGLAFAVSAGIRPLIAPESFAVYFGAVALAAWLWGRREATVTAVLSGLAVYLSQPGLVLQDPFAVLNLVTRLALFSLVSGLLIAVIDSLDKAGQNLRRSQARFAGIIDLSEEAILSIDDDRNIRLFNRGAEAMFGYSGGEILGRPLEILLPVRLRSTGDAGAGAIDRFEALAQRGEVYGLRKNGEEFPAEASIVRFTVSGERVVAVRMRDISERRRAERERASLLASEQAARAEAERALRLHRAVEQRLTWLVEASHTLLGSVRLSEVLEEAIQLSRRFLLADAYAVWRQGPDGTWRIVASHGLSPEHERIEIPAADWLYRTDQGVLAAEDIETSGLEPWRTERLRKEGVRSILDAPMRIHGHRLGVLAAYYRSPHRFHDIELRVAAALGNLTASGITSSELYEQQERMRLQAEEAQRRSAFLAQATAMLGSSLDYRNTLAGVAQLAVPQFADVCAVDVAGPDGAIERLAAVHGRQAAADWGRDLFRGGGQGRLGVAAVIASGKPEVRFDIPSMAGDELAEVLGQAGLCSAIIMPLVIRGRGVGAISFAQAGSGRRLGPEDLAIAEHMGRRAALAVDNSRLYHQAQRERAEAEEAANALRRSNQDLSQFAYVASHDLQEPLRMVASYTQMLAKRYQSRLDSQADEFIGFAVEGVNRMQALIDDLLAYSQAASEGTVPTKVRVEAALAEAIANLQFSIEQSGAVVTHNELPEISTERVQLVQLLQNLLSNAIKYRGREKPLIHVSASDQEDEWRFSVRDNGIGIDSRYAERIFGIFKRLHGREYPGTGVGLAICRKIVERYGGRIWVESQVGMGSTFFFTIPK